MCDKQGNSYYVHYNIKEVLDQWDVGPMGCRTNGLSDHREVTVHHGNVNHVKKRRLPPSKT